MTRPHTTRPGQRRWRRQAHAFAAVAVPLALAASALPTSGVAAAQPTTPDAGSAAPRHELQPLSLPGLHDDSYSITLLNGDKVRLTAAGAGHYSVVATPTPGSAGVTVNTTGGPAGVKTLQATPSAAQFLIASGQIDDGLFDVQYLASHGYTDGTGKALPVTVQYTDHPDADAINHRADSLPASTVAATDTRSGTADLRVDPKHATDLWAALTGTGTGATSNASRSGLTNGIAHIWLTGHRTADQQQVRPADGEPTYPVTLTMTLGVGTFDSQVAFCNGFASTMCGGNASISAVAGDSAGRSTTTNLSCVDQDPCTTLRAHFDVPAGTYIAASEPLTFWVDGQTELAWVAAPQVEVNGPTDVALDLSRLQRVNVNAPKPTDAYEGTVAWQRTLPDGSYFNMFGFSAYGLHNIWALPTDQPVTVGGFHFSTEWVLGSPPVTAHVEGSKGFDLRPMYPSYNTGGDTVVRFSDRKRVPVVDAGYGHPEDFAAIDARGKLALIRIGDDGTGWCNRASLGKVSKAQLDNAIKAGAVGVLIDPRSPNKVADGWCSLPIYFQFGADPNETPPAMPFAAIRPSEAARLEGMLQHGDVRMTITDSGVSSYTYNLKLYEERDIPNSLRYDIDDDQLTAVDTRLHADAPTPMLEHHLGVWRPDESIVGGVADELAWPARRTEYYGPAAPDLVYSRIWIAPPTTLSSLEVFDQRGGHRTEDINARPATPGPYVYDPAVPAAQPGDGKYAQFCALCRQGNALIPDVSLGQGNRSMHDSRVLNPATTHLYLGDGEISPTSVAGRTAYALPPERHTYRLVTDYDNAGFGHTHIDWKFSSAAPERDETPPGTLCHGVTGEPCRAEPFVFLSYDLGVALNNQLAAPGAYPFTVTANHQATDAPAIRDLKVSTSTDDGKTWKPALVLPLGRGDHGARSFSVITAVPPLNQTTGTLSIKAQATDAGGNSVEQTMIQAVKLSQGTERGWPGHRVWE